MTTKKTISEEIALSQPWVSFVMLAATFLVVALSSQSTEPVRNAVAGVAIYANFAWWLIFVASAHRTARLYSTNSSQRIREVEPLLVLGLALLVMSLPPMLFSAIDHEAISEENAQGRFFMNASIVALQFFMFVFLYFCLILRPKLERRSSSNSVRGILLFLAIVYIPIGQFIVRSRLIEMRVRQSQPENANEALV